MALNGTVLGISTGFKATGTNLRRTNGFFSGSAKIFGMTYNLEWREYSSTYIQHFLIPEIVRIDHANKYTVTPQTTDWYKIKEVTRTIRSALPAYVGLKTEACIRRNDKLIRDKLWIGPRWYQPKQN